MTPVAPRSFLSFSASEGPAHPSRDHADSFRIRPDLPPSPPSPLSNYGDHHLEDEDHEELKSRFSGEEPNSIRKSLRRSSIPLRKNKKQANKGLDCSEHQTLSSITAPSTMFPISHTGIQTTLPIPSPTFSTASDPLPSLSNRHHRLKEWFHLPKLKLMRSSSSTVSRFGGSDYGNVAAEETGRNSEGKMERENTKVEKLLGMRVPLVNAQMKVQDLQESFDEMELDFNLESSFDSRSFQRYELPPIRAMTPLSSTAFHRSTRSADLFTFPRYTTAQVVEATTPTSPTTSFSLGRSNHQSRVKHLSLEDIALPAPNQSTGQPSGEDSVQYATRASKRATKWLESPVDRSIFPALVIPSIPSPYPHHYHEPNPVSPATSFLPSVFEDDDRMKNEYELAGIESDVTGIGFASHRVGRIVTQRQRTLYRLERSTSNLEATPNTIELQEVREEKKQQESSGAMERGTERVASFLDCYEYAGKSPEEQSDSGRRSEETIRSIAGEYGRPSNRSLIFSFPASIRSGEELTPLRDSSRRAEEMKADWESDSDDFLHFSPISPVFDEDDHRLSDSIDSSLGGYVDDEDEDEKLFTRGGQVGSKQEESTVAFEFPRSPPHKIKQESRNRMAGIWFVDDDESDDEDEKEVLGFAGDKKKDDASRSFLSWNAV